MTPQPPPTRPPNATAPPPPTTRPATNPDRPPSTPATMRPNMPPPDRHPRIPRRTAWVHRPTPLGLHGEASLPGHADAENEGTPAEMAGPETAEMHAHDAAAEPAHQAPLGVHDEAALPGHPEPANELPFAEPAPAADQPEHVLSEPVDPPYGDQSEIAAAIEAAAAPEHAAPEHATHDPAAPDTDADAPPPRAQPASIAQDFISGTESFDGPMGADMALESMEPATADAEFALGRRTRQRHHHRGWPPGRSATRRRAARGGTPRSPRPRPLHAQLQDPGGHPPPADPADPGRQGGARVQGRRAHHLYLAGRAVQRADAQLAPRRRDFAQDHLHRRSPPPEGSHQPSCRSPAAWG